MIRKLSEVPWHRAKQVKRKKDGKTFQAVQMEFPFAIMLPDVITKIDGKKVRSHGGTIRGIKGDWIMRSGSFILACSLVDPRDPRPMNPVFTEKFEVL